MRLESIAGEVASPCTSACDAVNGNKKGCRDFPFHVILNVEMLNRIRQAKQNTDGYLTRELVLSLRLCCGGGGKRWWECR